MFSFTKLVALTSCAFVAVSAVAINTARQNNLPPPFGGTHSGDGTSFLSYLKFLKHTLKGTSGTFFEPGLGACGITNGPNDLIVAVSAQLYDSFP